MNAMGSDDPPLMCVECRAVFSESRDILARMCCPACGSYATPADRRVMWPLTLTEHEWRLLFLFAEAWAGHLAAQRRAASAPLDAIRGIAGEARRQLPGIAPLTTLEEARDLESLLPLHEPVPPSLTEPADV